MLLSRSSSHSPENGLRGREGAIELAKAPKNPTVGSGIASIQRVPMIQIDQASKCLLSVGRPFQKRFAPSHANIVVQLPVNQQRSLRRIPNGITSATPRHRFPRQQLTRITLMLTQRLTGPSGNCRDSAVILGGSSKIRKRVLAKSATRPGTFQRLWIVLPRPPGRFLSEPPCRSAGMATSYSHRRRVRCYGDGRRLKVHSL